MKPIYFVYRRPAALPAAPPVGSGEDAVRAGADAEEPGVRKDPEERKTEDTGHAGGWWLFLQFLYF